MQESYTHIQATVYKWNGSLTGEALVLQAKTLLARLGNPSGPSAPEKVAVEPESVREPKVYTQMTPMSFAEACRKRSKEVVPAIPAYVHNVSTIKKLEPVEPMIHVIVTGLPAQTTKGKEELVGVTEAPSVTEVLGEKAMQKLSALALHCNVEKPTIPDYQVPIQGKNCTLPGFVPPIFDPKAEDGVTRVNGFKSNVRSVSRFLETPIFEVRGGFFTGNRHRPKCFKVRNVPNHHFSNEVRCTLDLDASGRGPPRDKDRVDHVYVAVHDRALGVFMCLARCCRVSHYRREDVDYWSMTLIPSPMPSGSLGCYVIRRDGEGLPSFDPMWIDEYERMCLYYDLEGEPYGPLVGTCSIVTKDSVIRADPP